MQLSGFFLVTFLAILQTSWQFKTLYRSENAYNFDSETQTLEPWKGDPKCHKFTIQFAPEKSRKPTLLIFMGSMIGRKIPRLLQQSSGIFTGDYRQTKSRSLIKHEKEGGFWGFTKGPSDGTTIAQRKFLTGPAFDQLEDMSNYLSEINHRGILVLEHPVVYLMKVDQPGDLTKVARRWVENVKSWVMNTPADSPVLIVEFEDLIAKPEDNLSRMLEYMDVTEVNAERVRCALSEFTGEEGRKLAELVRLRGKYSRMIKEQVEMEPVRAVLEEGIAEINALMMSNTRSGDKLTKSISYKI